MKRGLVISFVLLVAVATTAYAVELTTEFLPNGVAPQQMTADEMFHPIRELSGGQKAKLLLLKISLTEAKVLILDEPTRNFSPLSGPEVRGILKQFPGAIISVSHDRKYITEVCNTVYRLTRVGLEKMEMPRFREEDF